MKLTLLNQELQCLDQQLLIQRVRHILIIIQTETSTFYTVTMVTGAVLTLREVNGKGAAHL